MVKALAEFNRGAAQLEQYEYAGGSEDIRVGRGRVPVLDGGPLQPRSGPAESARFGRIARPRGEPS